MSGAPRFSEQTNIQQALDLDARVREEFARLGLKCADCAAAEVETLRDAARYHGKPLDEIVAALNGLRLEKKPDGAASAPGR